MNLAIIISLVPVLLNIGPGLSKIIFKVWPNTEIIHKRSETGILFSRIPLGYDESSSVKQGTSIISNASLLPPWSKVLYGRFISWLFPIRPE